MLEVLLTAGPALCWLLCRLYQILQTPLEALFKKLSIDIPHAPKITIDQLQKNQVVLHWDTEEWQENVYFVVLVNVREAASLAGKLICLQGLEASKMYLIEVLAVNAATNFRSQSGAIYVTTMDVECDFEGDTWSVTPWMARDEKHSDEYKMSREAALSDAEKGLLEQIRHNQIELYKTRAEVAEISSSQQREVLQLLAAFEEYKYMLSEEHEQRGRKDLDVKTLEKKKDSLTFEKLKLSKQLRNHKSHKLIHKASLAELRSRVAKLEEKKQHVLNLADLEKARVKSSVDQLHKDIAGLKDDLAEFENQAKLLNSDRKELAHQVNVLKPLVDQFTVFNPQPTGETSPNGSQVSLTAVFEVFTRDSLLTKGGAELLKKITSLQPDWDADINREFEALTALELSWKNAYRNVIRKFVQVHNNAEMTRAAATPGYVPQKITEYQASVEFGGFSNALPKLRPPKVYTFVDENSPAPESPASNPVSPPLPDSEKMPPFFNRVNEEDNNLSSLGSEPMNRDFSDRRDLPDINVSRDYPMAQGQSLNMPLMASSSSLAQTQSLNLNIQPQPLGYGHQQSFSQSSLPQSHVGANLNHSVPLEPTPSGTLIQASLLGNHTQNQDSLLNFLFPLPNNLLPGIQDRSHLPGNLQDSLQPNLQPFLSGLPYEDQMYGMRSPTPDPPAFNQQPLPSLWNTNPANNSSNFMNQRFPNQMSLSPGPMNVELSPSQSVVSQSGDTLLDTLLLSNNPLLPQSSLQLNIWLDRLNPGLGSHNRALSGGNHIWRNDVHNGTISPDFQPFQSRRKEGDEADDIQLL